MVTLYWPDGSRTFGLLEERELLGESYLVIHVGGMTIRLDALDELGVHVSGVRRTSHCNSESGGIEK